MDKAENRGGKRPNTGGKRVGAGRKTRTGRTEKITISIRPELKAAIIKKALEDSEKLSALVEKAIEFYLNSDPGLQS